MGTSIPTNILSLKGQRVNKIDHDQAQHQVIIHCSRDRRRSPVDPSSGLKGTINQYLRRQVRDYLLWACLAFLILNLHK